MGVENRFLGLAVAPMTRLDWETAFWRDWNRPAFCRIDWEWVAVRWAAGFWKLQGLTRVEVGDVEVVHGAGDGADVFPEGWFH